MYFFALLTGIFDKTDVGNGWARTGCTGIAVKYCGVDIDSMSGDGALNVGIDVVIGNARRPV